MLSPRRSRNSGSSDDGELVSMAAKTRNSSRTTSGQGDETELFADCRGEDEAEVDESFEEEALQVSCGAMPTFRSNITVLLEIFQK